MKFKYGLYLWLLLLLFTGNAHSLTPQDSWYPNLARYDEVSKLAVLPKLEGVVIVDSRPGARKYDKGHIPGAISIPDLEFDKLTGRLPADKASQLIFYCGGVKCMLSHKSAFKAEKLGYTNIKVYAEGFPDWKAKGGLVSVPVSHIKAQLDKKANIVVVDSRPKKRKYDKGHIPGAISIPDTTFDAMTAMLPADKATPLYFYCGGLQCKLSSNSAHKAIKLGYTKVKIVAEGYPAWKKAYGKSGASKLPEIKPGNDSGTISVVSFEEIYKTAPDTLMIIDVRDAEEFATGTFKGAINIPINDLEKRMDELGGDKIIVFFCGAGGRSGEAYDMLQMFKPKLKSYFLNAEITFKADGSYTMKELE